MRRSHLVRRYSLDAGGVAHLIEQSRLQHPADPKHKTIQDANAGAVLADALDENGEPHAPFFRNLVHGRYPDAHPTVETPDGNYRMERQYPHPVHGRFGSGDNTEFVFRQANPTEEGQPVAAHVTRIVNTPRTADSHIAVMHPDALREWAKHPAVSPSMRAHLHNVADHLDEQNKPHETKPLPMSRRRLALTSKPHLFAKRPPKVVPSYPELVTHAATALDNPHSDIAVQSFADHLSDTHPGEMADAFQKWVGGQGNHMVLAPFVHPRHVKGYFVRGPYTSHLDPGGEQNHPATPEYEIQHTQSQADRSNGGVLLPSYGRRWADKGWTVRRENPRHPVLVTTPVDRKMVPTVEVANRLYNELGPAGLVQAIVGARHFRPDNASNHVVPPSRGTETGGVRFGRGVRYPKTVTPPVPPRTTVRPATNGICSRYTLPKKVVKYAKVEKDRHPAHPLIAGFPIEHFLRHLANDSSNAPHVRDIAKSALTGKGHGGQDVDVPTSLWALHDALHEVDHPTKSHYNLMSAADKVGLDAHTMSALIETTHHHNIGLSAEQRAEWRNGPENYIRVIAHGLRSGSGNYAKQRADDLVHRVGQLSGETDRSKIVESIHRHEHRARQQWSERVSPTVANSYRDAALTHIDALPNLGSEEKARRKATRYRKRLPPRRYALFEGPHGHEDAAVYTKPARKISGFPPGTKFVSSYVPRRNGTGTWMWEYNGTFPHSSHHGPYESLPDSSQFEWGPENGRHEPRPLSPEHLWSYDLPGGKPPTAPDAPDYRPNESTPEDFYAMSRGRYPKRYSLANRSNFLDALRRIRSSNQKAMHQSAQEVGKKLGLHPLKTLDALHDTPHGSVPGVAQAVYGNATPEQVHSAAALMSLTSNLPGSAVFHVRSNGPDLLHRVRVEGSGADMRSRMDRYGLTSRVIIPHRRGYDVLVPDKGGKLQDKVQQFATDSKVSLETSPGHFSTLGSADQANARKIFRNKVVQQEQAG